MAKTALVLSGGGASGSFQVGAEKYLREVRGYRWDLIAGVSVGALNGGLIAMNAQDELERVWQAITPDLVFGKHGLLNMPRQLLRRQSLFSNQGIRKFADLIDPAKMVVEMRVGAVSLTTGDFVSFSSSHPHFKDALLASTAIPLIFPPVRVGPEHPAMIDGGARNASPLTLVLRDLPDEIVIINCSSLPSVRSNVVPKTAFDICQRALEIALAGIFDKDISRVLPLNRIVEQAEAHGLTLVNPTGRPFRKLNITLIEPEQRLGTTTDFSSKHLRRAYQAGWDQAKKVVG